ncbi:MAG: TonB family protein [Calditrichaceae bacterium]|jgi:TonB family protein
MYSKSITNRLLGKYLFLIIIMAAVKAFAVDSSLTFVNEPLRQVINEFSNYYSVNLIYNDEMVENKTVTCDINDLNREDAFREIFYSLNISTRQINEKTYVLYPIPAAPLTHPENTAATVKKKKSLLLVPPKAITDTHIMYPKLAKEKGFEGSVGLQIFINKTGKVEKANIEKSSSSAILDQAALDYARNMRFQPAKIDSQSIPVWSKWQIVFKLIPSDTTYSEFNYDEIVR